MNNNKYPVLTLCGSTRFKKEFEEIQKKLTLDGVVVLSVGVFGHADDNLPENFEKIKVMLDEIHKQKIDMADAIMVVNIGGYIGESTKSEIEYAKIKGKHIYYWEE